MTKKVFIGYPGGIPKTIDRARIMPLTRVHSAAIVGLDAVDIEVEVDISNVKEKQSMTIVGLPDAIIKESKERVLTAMKNSNFVLRDFVCTINLAPGNLRKEGALFDLPMALGFLRSCKLIHPSLPLEEYTLVGELGFSGEVRPIQGALAIALLARTRGKKGIVLPFANAREAAAVPGIQVIGVQYLRDVIPALRDPLGHAVKHEAPPFALGKPLVDFSEIKGQHQVKRAAEIAAAGGHNLLLKGPPGTGKTMIAKALTGIMPPLTYEEALEITKVHSIAGMLPRNQSLIHYRPFRSPHHTVSYAGLIGGGASPRPGEVSLAHHGILFLDELPEFSRKVLEVLRQPLEDRRVTISRANGHTTFPTSFLCIAAMNPCPCGFLGHPDKICTDTEAQVMRYMGKISGPLLDRFDMHVEVPALRYQDMINTNSEENSSTIRTRVVEARMRQKKRFGAVRCNAEMTPKELEHLTPLTPDCRDVIEQAIDVKGLSARACNRLIRVARTIADLEGSPHIAQSNLLEALNYRS